MSTIVLRLVKGSALTWQEVDDNFSNLNNDKYEAGDNPTFGTVTAVTYNGLPVFTGPANGLVPAGSNSGTLFLRDDGTWQSAGAAENPLFSRQVEFACFGGNGAAIGGFGGPNHDTGGFGTYTSISGQENPTAGTSNPWLMLPYTQFSQSSTFGTYWGGTWRPFTKNLQPFGCSIIFRPRVIANAATNNWAFGFSSSLSYPTGGSGRPEDAFTNFFGFRYPQSGTGTTFLVVNRVSSVSTITDTLITIPTIEEVVRLGIYVDNDTITFTIEEMQSDLSFSLVYTYSIAVSSVSDSVWNPVFGGPASVGNIVNVAMIRGMYTI